MRNIPIPIDVALALARVSYAHQFDVEKTILIEEPVIGTNNWAFPVHEIEQNQIISRITVPRTVDLLSIVSLMKPEDT